MPNVRDLVVRNVLMMFPPFTLLDFQMLVNRLRPGAFNRVPQNASPENAVNVMVDLALTEGWVKKLVLEIPKNPVNSAELTIIQALLAAAVEKTVDDPFEEVLLEGNRPFVNRRELRDHLRSLCGEGGAPLLVVSGKEGTGKSYSFYLAQHAARQHEFTTSQFDVSARVQLEELASEILDRLGVSAPLREKGTESAVRWADKLAAQVKDAIEEAKVRRMFVFDEFPETTKPPEETVAFIVRLARYADEELRDWLRVVLIEFNASLPNALEDVAARDEAQPFTATDMFTGLKQIAKARGWSISDEALQTEINELLATDIPLRDRFHFMKRAIKRLQGGSPGGSQ